MTRPKQSLVRVTLCYSRLISDCLHHPITLMSTVAVSHSGPEGLTVNFLFFEIFCFRQKLRAYKDILLSF